MGKAFEEAVVKLADNLPEILQTINNCSKAMDELARAIGRMPHSVRMRP